MYSDMNEKGKVQYKNVYLQLHASYIGPLLSLQVNLSIFSIFTEQNRIFILFKHIQLITITKLQNAWIIKYTYTV